MHQAIVFFKSDFGVEFDLSKTLRGQKALTLDLNSSVLAVAGLNAKKCESQAILARKKTTTFPTCCINALEVASASWTARVLRSFLKSANRTLTSSCWVNAESKLFRTAAVTPPCPIRMTASKSCARDFSTRFCAPVRTGF